MRTTRRRSDRIDAPPHRAAPASLRSDCRSVGCGTGDRTQRGIGGQVRCSAQAAEVDAFTIGTFDRLPRTRKMPELNPDWYCENRNCVGVGNRASEHQNSVHESAARTPPVAAAGLRCYAPAGGRPRGWTASARKPGAVPQPRRPGGAHCTFPAVSSTG